MLFQTVLKYSWILTQVRHHLQWIFWMWPPWFGGQEGLAVWIQALSCQLASRKILWLILFNSLDVVNVSTSSSPSSLAEAISQCFQALAVRHGIQQDDRNDMSWPCSSLKFNRVHYILKKSTIIEGVDQNRSTRSNKETKTENYTNNGKMNRPIWFN